MSSEKIAWIDVETNGIKPGHLLQVAVIVTDSNLQELVAYESKIFHTKEQLEKVKEDTIEYVLNMHSQNGIWEALDNGEGKSASEVDQDIFDILESFEVKPRKILMGGNSITLDRNFMEVFLPKSFEHLSYQSVDMTSVSKFFVMFKGREPYIKRLAHDALEDIRESISEARYHRDYSD